MSNAFVGYCLLQLIGLNISCIGVTLPSVRKWNSYYNEVLPYDGTIVIQTNKYLASQIFYITK